LLEKQQHHPAPNVDKRRTASNLLNEHVRELRSYLTLIFHGFIIHTDDGKVGTFLDDWLFDKIVKNIGARWS
jgi:hypothetical protein